MLNIKCTMCTTVLVLSVRVILGVLGVVSVLILLNCLKGQVHPEVGDTRGREKAEAGGEKDGGSQEGEDGD